MSPKAPGNPAFPDLNLGKKGVMDWGRSRGLNFYDATQPLPIPAPKTGNPVSQISVGGRMVDAPFQSGANSAAENYASVFGQRLASQNQNPVSIPKMVVSNRNMPQNPGAYTGIASPGKPKELTLEDRISLEQPGDFIWRPEGYGSDIATGEYENDPNKEMFPADWYTNPEKYVGVDPSIYNRQIGEGQEFSPPSLLPVPQTILPPAPQVESQSQATAAPTGFGGVEIPGAPSLTQSTGGAPGNPLANMFPKGWQNLGDNYASLFGG